MTYAKNNKMRKLLILVTVVIVAVLMFSVILTPEQIVLAGYLTDSDLPTDLASYDYWYFGESEDYQYDLEAMKTAISSWGLPEDSTNFEPVLIGVIDTGINTSHPLIQKVLYKPLKIAEADGTPIPEQQQTTVTIGYNVVGDSTAIEDVSSDRHGTHVAGIIATMIVELGLEDFIKIVPIRAVDTSNSFTVGNIVSAINWACGDNNAQTILGKPLVCDVVNLSLGILNSTIGSSSSWNNRALLIDALDVHSATTNFVASAGNNSADSAQDLFYPAAIENVVSVMSYNTAGGLFSSSNYGNYDLVAPGQNIYSASSGSSYVLKTGTSMASPFVTFGAALLRLRYDMSSQQATFGGNPTARQIAKMLRTHSTQTIEVNGTEETYNLKVFDLDQLAVLDFSLENFDIGYADPTKLTVTYADNSQVIQYMDSRVPIDFSVSISPTDEYNPIIEEEIVWWVETLNTETEPFEIGTGTNCTLPIDLIGGDYNIYATLTYQNKTLTSNKQAVSIKYLAPNFEKIKIAPIAKISNYNGNGRDVPSYIGYTTVLSLTDIEYVDQTVEINWYVNDVLMGTGATFNFTPTEKGTYNIAAKYDGHNIYYDFVLETTAAPISFWLDALIAMLIALAVFGYIFLEVSVHRVGLNGELENSVVAKVNKILYTFENKQVKLKSRNQKKANKEALENKVEKTEAKVASRFEEKHVMNCPKCAAYVKFRGNFGKCPYCGTRVDIEDTEK